MLPPSSAPRLALDGAMFFPRFSPVSALFLSYSCPVSAPFMPCFCPISAHLRLRLHFLQALSDHWLSGFFFAVGPMTRALRPRIQRHAYRERLRARKQRPCSLRDLPSMKRRASEAQGRRIRMDIWAFVHDFQDLFGHSANHLFFGWWKKLKNRSENADFTCSTLAPTCSRSASTCSGPAPTCSGPAPTCSRPAYWCDIGQILPM